jgi:hypothetical protein
LVPDFPEFFPVVRNAFATAEGHLGFRLWTAMPEQQERFLVLNRQGTSVETAYAAEHAARVIAIHEGQALLSACDEDEGAFLVKIPVGRINAWATANPITVEQAPRMLMITD